MPTDRPNILWYCTDQQRFDTIGALGNPFVNTPVVDQLVREGVAFTHAYCQSPICTPSRSSFMAGMYPTRVHNTRNGNDTFPDYPPLITKLIADSGYVVAKVGSGQGDPRDFDPARGLDTAELFAFLDYDPARVSYEELLEVYWVNVDPFDARGQFCDKGPSYRAAIFVAGDEERGDTLVPQRRIDRREHDEHAGRQSVGDPHLLA